MASHPDPPQRHTHHLHRVRGRGLLQSRFAVLYCPERVQPAQPDRNDDRPLGYQWERTDFVRRSARASGHFRGSSENPAFDCAVPGFGGPADRRSACRKILRGDRF